MKTRPPQHSAKASTKSARQRRIRLDGHVIATEFRGALLPPGETVGACTELTACVDPFGSHGYPVTSPRKLITNLRRHRNEVCCDNNSDPRAGPTDTFDDRLWVRRSQGSSTWSSASWASRASIARPPRGHRKGSRRFVGSIGALAPAARSDRLRDANVKEDRNCGAMQKVTIDSQNPDRCGATTP